MRNVQSRVIDAPPSTVGTLIDTLAGPDDRLWPTDTWPAIKFDRGLAVGSTGGHGPIRYYVSAYEPGKRVRFTFTPETGIQGYHELRVEPIGPATTRLVHEGVGRTFGRTRLTWPLAVRWLHEALIQDLLDNAQREATGRPANPRRWSPWVRLLRRVAGQPRQPRVDLGEVAPQIGRHSNDFS